MKVNSVLFKVIESAFNFKEFVFTQKNTFAQVNQLG